MCGGMLVIVARGIALGVHSGLAGPEGPVKSEAPHRATVACKQHKGGAPRLLCDGTMG